MPLGMVLAIIGCEKRKLTTSQDVVIVPMDGLSTIPSMFSNDSSDMEGRSTVEEVSHINSPFVHLTKWVVLALMIFTLGAPHFGMGGGGGDMVSEEIVSVLFGIRHQENGEGLADSGNETLPGEVKSSEEAATDADEAVITDPDSAETTDYVEADPDSESGVFAYLPSRLNLSARAVQLDPVSESEETLSLFPGESSEDPFDKIIQKAAGRYEVDPSLVKAIIMVESSYNPKAVSYKGAKGLMQLMPRTARALGVEDSFDPELNIDAGVRYFRQLLNQFNGNIKLAIAAYNAGSRKVRKYNGVPPFKRTRYYVAKVMEYHQLYQQ
jgi:hypothetical protein